MSTSRIPPHSNEAEESVLGSILLDNDCINNIQEKLHGEDYYKPAHKHIFEAMTELYDKQIPIDIISLTQRLKDKELLQNCGGPDYISHLANVAPSSAHAPHYAQVVKDMSIRRRVIHECSNIIAEAFNTGEEVADFLDTTESKILKISDNRGGAGFVAVENIVQDSIKIIEKMYDRKEPITGVPTGFRDLNSMTAGFQNSDLIVLAARPSMGKTSLALSVAQHVGIHEKIAVAVFSLEMSKEQLVMRMLCSEAQVDSSRVRTGYLADRDFPRLVDAASRIAEAPIYIDDTPALTVSAMRAKTRRLARDAAAKGTPLGMVIVDYLQLMKSPLYMNSREQEISDISRSLKGLAKELSIPVIALAQLNRSVESRVDKRPIMSDLRESGAIEQDSDIIMFIYRDEVYNQTTEARGIAEIIVAKHRSGPTGMVKLGFAAEYTRFFDLEQDPSLQDMAASQETLLDLDNDDSPTL